MIMPARLGAGSARRIRAVALAASAITIAIAVTPAAVGQNIHIDNSGASGGNPTDGKPVNLTVSSAIPATACGVGGSVSPCVYVLSNGGSSDLPPNGVGALGGPITINNTATIGQGDSASTVYGSVPAGIAAVSAGGSPAYTDFGAAVNGAISISNSGLITTGNGNAASAPTVGLVITTTRQVSVPTQSLTFGGGLLAYSAGGVGSPNNGAFDYTALPTGGNAGAITLSNGGTIMIGAYQSWALPPATNAGMLAISIGGDAAADGTTAQGGGGNGGDISILNSGVITTAGRDSPGMSALSQGGGNGLPSASGGYVEGGNGGTVDAYSGGMIATTGDTSPGVVAISSGGNLILSQAKSNGGSAGPVSYSDAAGASITTSGTFSPGLVVSSVAGGLLQTDYREDTRNPPSSGTSGTVSVVVDGAITTTGNASDGLIAQSIGAGGGATSVSPDATSYTLGSPSVALGSTAAAVTVTNNGTISTGGAAAGGAYPQSSTSNPDQDSIGIVAQSIAGGGGVAFLSSGATTTTVGGTAGSTGGGDNNGGGVTVANDGAIATTQFGGDGVLAQSIGGGGGDAKGPSHILGIGGTGGAGGQGGTVSVTNSGMIATSGWQADGMVGQSIGGGGGAGSNASRPLAAVGGSGGSGGAGGAVSMTNGAGGVISAQGDDSVGILAQSIGGGGGIGGKASAWGTVTLPPITIGGAGGSGGTGGAVTVTNLGAIGTGIAALDQGADAIGILAQSIGGGGGTGGVGTATDSGLWAFALALGGTAGGGGGGGGVTVSDGLGPASGSSASAPAAIQPAATITTVGPDAYGIEAQSLGGGGGNGGQSSARASAAVSGSVTEGDVPSFALALAVGGAGGVGGNGAAVTVNLGAAIGTQGQGADAVLAQSIGGGGGAGGDSTALAVSQLQKSGATTLSVSTEVGGNGGGAGNGGAVTVNADAGAIATTGDHAHGILAQSIGGGGGVGGVGDSFARAPTYSDGAISLTIAVGGRGGGGGDGGTVMVNQFATISTAGSGADGIEAQSIGGGGGAADGGTLGTTSKTGSTTNAISGNISIGGDGGAGGAAAAGTSSQAGVTVANAGTITTSGGSAYAILAQSIGGGGGSGGSSDPQAGLGGSNPLDLAGKLYGEGSAIYESFAKYQAGESSGLAGAWGAYSAVGSKSLSLTIGGAGGTGGDGGSVAITNAPAVNPLTGATTTGIAAIATSGAMAHAVVAQSVGGGGGEGGAAQSDPLPGHDVTDVGGYTVTLGGAAGGGGTGGTVLVTNGAPQAFVEAPGQGIIYNGQVSTFGMQSVGIVAQSVGGGGGLGGVGSVGGGTLALVFGGAGGSGSAGGMVTVTNNGAVTTAGADSIGVFAQSVGGGGGYAASAVASTGTDASMTFPGSGGSGAVGGTVSVNQPNGAIATGGARAFGILAQSVGGGGGVGGTGPAAQALSWTHVFGSGHATTSSGNNGGAVNVTLSNNGDIQPYDTGVTTSGAGAWGIVAQSVGGGGGITGDSTVAVATGTPASNIRPADATVAGTSGLAGYGGNIAITIGTGTSVTTTGAQAHGIVAQSIGGGGGIVDGGLISAGGSDYGRGITINVQGEVIASGTGSYGVIAQSLGQGGKWTNVATGSGSGNGAILITLGTGTPSAPGTPINGLVQGGAGAAGILVAGGNADNATTIAAGGELCASLCAPSGSAFVADAATATVTRLINNGTLIGTVSGDITMVNDPATWTTAGVSTVNTITNGIGGVIDIGGRGTATAVINQVAGATQPVLTLGPGSSVLMDADFLHQTHDTLIVNGVLQSAGGTITVRPGTLVPESLSGVLTARAIQGRR